MTASQRNPIPGDPAPFAGLLIGSALAAGIGGLEGSALAPVTDIAATIFAISAVVGIVAVLILSWRLYRLSRLKHRDALDRL